MTLHNPKLIPLQAMVEARQRLRAAGKILVMTNGCFDLLHTGHIYFLQQARKLGDQLVVALNSDASTRPLGSTLTPSMMQSTLDTNSKARTPPLPVMVIPPPRKLILDGRLGMELT